MLRRLVPSVGRVVAAGARRHAVSAVVTPPDTARLVASLEASHAKSIESLVPWFATQMPPTYFRVFGEDTQRRHLRAIAALFDEELRVRASAPSVAAADQQRALPALVLENAACLCIPPARSQPPPLPPCQVDQLTLTSHSAGVGGELLSGPDSELHSGPDSELHTFLSQGVETSAAKLAERVASLPGDAELRRVLVFRSEDGGRAAVLRRAFALPYGFIARHRLYSPLAAVSCLVACASPSLPVLKVSFTFLPWPFSLAFAVPSLACAITARLHISLSPPHYFPFLRRPAVSRHLRDGPSVDGTLLRQKRRRGAGAGGYPGIRRPDAAGRLHRG